MLAAGQPGPQQTLSRSVDEVGQGEGGRRKAEVGSAAEMDFAWLEADSCTHRCCGRAGQHLPPTDHWHLACSVWLSIHNGLSCVSSAGFKVWGCANSLLHI